MSELTVYQRRCQNTVAQYKKSDKWVCEDGKIINYTELQLTYCQVFEVLTVPFRLWILLIFLIFHVSTEGKNFRCHAMQVITGHLLLMAFLI